MSRRKVLLVSNETYHVFNRSIAKTKLFSSKIHLRKILETVDYYRYPQTIRLSKFKTFTKDLKEEYIMRYKKTKPLVEIYTYAFMPNHYHFLTKQLSDRGIMTFISNTQNSFAKYFNLKYNRAGSLFQNAFKATRITSEAEFVHVSRYIHLNPVTSYLMKTDDLPNDFVTSFPYYQDAKEDPLINTKLLIGIFQTKDRYKDFVFNQIDYQRKLDHIKHLIFERVWSIPEVQIENHPWGVI